MERLSLIRVIAVYLQFIKDKILHKNIKNDTMNSKIKRKHVENLRGKR